MPDAPLKLSNASIANLKQYVADPVTGAEYDAYDLEEVSFTYQKIEIVDAIGGKSWADAWDARV